MVRDFKVGDYIFYFSDEAGTFPSKVYAVTKKRVLIDNPKVPAELYKALGCPPFVYVNKSNCVLQSEWEKENQ